RCRAALWCSIDAHRLRSKAFMGRERPEGSAGWDHRVRSGSTSGVPEAGEVDFEKASQGTAGRWRAASAGASRTPSNGSPYVATPLFRLRKVMISRLLL